MDYKPRLRDLPAVYFINAFAGYPGYFMSFIIWLAWSTTWLKSAYSIDISDAAMITITGTFFVALTSIQISVEHSESITTNYVLSILLGVLLAQALQIIGYINEPIIALLSGLLMGHFLIRKPLGLLINLLR